MPEGESIAPVDIDFKPAPATKESIAGGSRRPVRGGPASRRPSTKPRTAPGTEGKDTAPMEKKFAGEEILKHLIDIGKIELKDGDPGIYLDNGAINKELMVRLSSKLASDPEAMEAARKYIKDQQDEGVRFAETFLPKPDTELVDDKSEPVYSRRELEDINKLNTGIMDFFKNPNDEESKAKLAHTLQVIADPKLLDKIKRSRAYKPLAFLAVIAIMLLSLNFAVGYGISSLAKKVK